MTTEQIFLNALNSKSDLFTLNESKKNEALLSMADSLIEFEDEILSANIIDIKNAKGEISDVMIDRLTLNHFRIQSMSAGIRDVAKLPDPNGKVLKSYINKDGLSINKVAVPMGVIGIIFESRPNVTSDAAALCFKSSNVCILRCGKEAHGTSCAIVKALQNGLKKCNINPYVVQLIEDISRDSANKMMTAKGVIDLLIPRGGKGLIQACVKNATVPCIETGTGICHIYIEKSADINMALNIVENAKTSRPSVCNACEVCLVDKDIASSFLPKLYTRLTENKEHPVKFIVDESASEYIDGSSADESSFDTEFLDYILAIKVVCDTSDAVKHISEHSTHHSEAIVTKNDIAADYFVKNVDSAAVYVNASTRFTDGGEFGLGCEMGISTQKLHARGPMGLEELMSYHYVIKGEGQVR